jgi:hypothetical protein
MKLWDFCYVAQFDSRRQFIYWFAMMLGGEPEDVLASRVSLNWGNLGICVRAQFFMTLLFFSLLHQTLPPLCILGARAPLACTDEALYVTI